jgi:hypothetical protein
LFWLGNCQVQRSGTDGLAELQAAQDCFERCLVVSTLSPEMHSAAMQNLEVVHLRLAQLQPPSARDPENPPNHEEPKNNDRPNRDPKRQLGSEGAEPGREQGFTKSATPGGKTNADKEPRGTDQPPPPGAGKRQPPADRAELVPISPQEASEHLEQAAQRILGEEMQHRKSKARPPQQGVRDW